MPGVSTHGAVHVLADGAAWMNAQTGIASGKQRDPLIDWCHFLELLGETANTGAAKSEPWLTLAENAKGDYADPTR